VIDDNARILIIEDERNIRKLISVNLVARGYDVIEAEDAQEGLARLRDASPSILLLDIKLPDMSGWEVLKIMTDDPAYHPIPVIVITASIGSANPDDKVSESEYLRKVLKKPISIQELTAEVKEALN
jgi:DNA-binding response OmpR family regulator